MEDGSQLHIMQLKISTLYNSHFYHRNIKAAKTQIAVVRIELMNVEA